MSNWNSFAMITGVVLLLYLLSRAIFSAYFNAKEDFVNRLIDKHKRKGIGNGVQRKD